MVDEGDVVDEIEAFIGKWPGEYQPVRDGFRLFYRELSTMAGVTLSFSARPGVSYSLRFHHSNLIGRKFFAIIDVIDDEPESRWLSVCFYENMITDPEERGELIPGGLAGGDGYCFDLTNDDSELVGYIVVRLLEAQAAASG